MAIRELTDRKLKKYQVYWNDPVTKKRKSKAFSTLKQARRFDATCKMDLEDYRNKHPGIRLPVASDNVVYPTPVSEISELRCRCQSLYDDTSVRVADIFDYVMQTLDIPVRFKDVLAVAQKEKKRDLPPRLRVKILKRDGYRCKMCGATAEET